MSSVFVIDTHHNPLMPCSPARARILLRQRRAAVFRRFPFTIILKHSVANAHTQPLRLKLDPGSKITGVGIVNDTTGEVLFAAEIIHRGEHIMSALAARRRTRRRRRQRHTRYRAPRFLNRRRRKGWLPPSLESRLANTLTWVARLRKLCPITHVSQELVRFDTQALQRPEIMGTEYQQGTLAGYELREYLLEKWERRCAYCGVTGVPLQIEHIVPKARGGTDRASNLTLACEPCNWRKNTQTAAEFGHPEVQARAQQPLKDAAAVNTIRWALYERLQATGLPIEVGTGGCTKYNRILRGLPKAHWLDAICVGRSTPSTLHVKQVRTLLIWAVGHGNRQMCGLNKRGFPIRHRQRQKVFFGFQTGDMVRAMVPAGLKTAGVHVGRLLVRASGRFDISTARGRVAGINYRYCVTMHHHDGYQYLESAVPSHIR
jgi:5-methylcytosine-specific restriction endonuclease McrA